ncbi:afadin-like isoform X2 [Hydractinia symbiolongicarpus]|uniref:afadin-like isoform X2 n=1 Tax=Hydractinia symbiolongicarpus TaxID=13093 RepID=UPI00254A9496|nr:afadin-like isoform X2 [Hydractinia symbiolongicarpus]
MDPEFEAALKKPQYFKEFAEEWHASRIDLFRLTLTSGPNEVPKFHGVIRFYFQDQGQKASTKCLRFNNEQTVSDIMPQLIEKFCPDMKMLSTPNYELFEIHSTGDVRKLSANEKPLLVQLLWHKDDREGRFLLKSANLKVQARNFFVPEEDSRKKEESVIQRSVYRLSRKYRKKRKEEMNRKRNATTEKDAAMAQELFRDLPESTLTRTKSNPEAVMRRRRHQKLEKRIKEFQNKGGPQTGGILKIFAESLKPEIPYKTILASVKDNTKVVTQAALEKFLLPKEDPEEYCIVMAIIPAGVPNPVPKERIIRPSDCPLAIQNSWPKENGVITFHLRKNGLFSKKNSNKSNEKNKSTSNPPNKRNKKGVQKANSSDSEKNNERNNDGGSNEPPEGFSCGNIVDRDILPYFLELTPEGKEINYKPKIYYIRPNETIIGSSRNPSPDVQYLQLFSPKILASHCSIVNALGTVSIVPHGPEADVRVSDQRIYDNTLLHSGDVVQFGGLHTFRFHNPNDDPPERNSIGSDENLSPYKSSVSSPPLSPELIEMVLNEQTGSAVDEDGNGVDDEMASIKPVKVIHGYGSLEDVSQPSMKGRLSRHSVSDLLDMDNNVEENLLPAALTFLNHGRDAFFAAIISGINVNFKLAPTYTLYLAARHIISPDFQPGLNETNRMKLLSSITKGIASSIQQTIQENDRLAGGLAFWMANASELLHFYRQDSTIGPLTKSAQAILAQSIQEAFALLVNAMEEELSLALPAFFDPSEYVDIRSDELNEILNDDLLERAESVELLNWTNDGPFSVTPMDADGRPLSSGQWIAPGARIRHNGSPVMADILYILSSAMSLLRRCRVNAALTIQLFSQLFHFINMWTFNRIVFEPQLRLCSELWGHCLRMRLSFIEAWAERQGLELAADCHLARIVQTAHLLEAPKDNAEDISNIAEVCFKLNSLQLRYLLENYLPEPDEPEIPQELIEHIVKVAESTSDQLTHNDGRDVKLEEDFQLQLPFLLPEEGYSSDIIRGVPVGLQEFLEPLCETGLCELTINPLSSGLWTVYQEPYEIGGSDDGTESLMGEAPPIQRVTINKGKSGLGLSICAAKGAQSEFNGIYIKAVIAGSVADQDGNLEAGDQIISVNESSLIDVTQKQAARIMGKSGPIITLEVMKHAAFHHGLEKLVENDENMPNVVPPPRPEEPEKVHVNSNNSQHYDQEKRYHDQKNLREVVDGYPEDQAVISHYNKPYPDEHSVETFNESDYDSDGNLLTPEEKATRAKLRQRQLEYEMRLARMEEERKFQEEELKLQEEERRMQEEELLRKQQHDEELGRRRSEAEEWARAEELELEREAEKRYEEEARQRRLEEEREKMRLAKEREKELAEERRREEEGIREKMRLAEEKRAWEEKLAEEKRRQEEQLEVERQRQEERRRKEEHERLHRIKAEEAKRRQEEEEMKRHEEERIRKEEEMRRVEKEERIRQMKEEQERKRRQDIEDQKAREVEEQKRRDYFLAEQQRRQEEEEKKAEEARRKEKQKLIEERRKKEEERKKEQELRYQKKETERPKSFPAVKKEPERLDMRELDREMASIDDALREAEKIAAEMDLFMMEEEQKIEEDVKQKHRREEKEWSAVDAFTKKDINHNNTPAKPQKNLLSDKDTYSNVRTSKYETNIDSSSDEEETYNSYNRPNEAMSEQQRWIKEQKEKRERQKQEQDRLRQDRIKKQEQEKEKRMYELEMKKEQEAREMNEYLRSKQERERKEREIENQRQPPPVVKPRNFKLKNQINFGMSDSVRGEYKSKAEQDFDRRRSEIDNLPYVRNSVTNYSSDEDAPPRPPPPKNIPASPLTPPTQQPNKFKYSSTNGYQNNRSPPRSNEISSDSGLFNHSGHTAFNKRTPEPAVVNQGVGEPEVLDFRAKMKLFGSFQS